MSDNDRCAAMFAALNLESRRYVLAVLQNEYDRAQRNRRPVLRLIRGGQPTAALEADNTSARAEREGSK